MAGPSSGMNRLFDPRYVYERRHRIAPFLKARGRQLMDHTRARWHDADRFLAPRGLPLSENSRRLSALRNRFAGRRCFVLGNGPSLLVSDLHRLRGEITIASNKIYLAFGETSWRPTIYTVTDGIVMQNTAAEIRALPFPKIFPRGTDHLVGNDGHTMFCDLATDWVDVGDFRPGFSTDIRRHVYGGESVTYFNLQIAYHLGCREIYLIGVDFSFKIPQAKRAESSYEFVLEGEGEQNHFIKGYRPVGEKWTMPHLKEQEMAFACARDVLRREGGRIFNASRKTELTVFDRVDFDSLFPGTSGEQP